MNTAPLSSEPAPNHQTSFGGLQKFPMSRDRISVSQVKARPVYEFGSYLLDPAARLLLRKGEKVTVPPKAFDILVALIENRGRVLGKEELMQIIWPDTFVEQANLAVTVSLLRKALGERFGGGQYIETSPRRGYRFAAFVREISDISPDEIQEFLTGGLQSLSRDRVLATVMVVHISDLAAMDEPARQGTGVVDRPQAHLKKEIESFRGCLIEMTRNKVMATFDGPARAIRCAAVISEVARRLGGGIKVGLHTGECDSTDDKVRGTAVDICVQLALKASISEILISRTVKDLVTGSGFSFVGRGVQSFDEVPEGWEVFAVNRFS